MPPRKSTKRILNPITAIPVEYHDVLTRLLAGEGNALDTEIEAQYEATRKALPSWDRHLRTLHSTGWAWRLRNTMANVLLQHGGETFTEVETYWLHVLRLCYFAQAFTSRHGFGLWGDTWGVKPGRAVRDRETYDRALASDIDFIVRAWNGEKSVDELYPEYHNFK